MKIELDKSISRRTMVKLSAAALASIGVASKMRAIQSTMLGGATLAVNGSSSSAIRLENHKIAVVLDHVPYGVGSWSIDEGLGNHRACVQVFDQAEAVWVHIPWRRRDPKPEDKNIVIRNAATGLPVKNLVRANINREFGDLVFEPISGPGEYHIYYMPFIPSPRTTDVVNEVYTSPKDSTDPGWTERHGLTSEKLKEGVWKKLPRAKVLEIQSRTKFDSFYPMEVIATQAETSRLLQRHPDSSYLLFPEDRRFPIRMTDDLPMRWIAQVANAGFHGEAARNEFYTFQVGVYAARKTIENLTVKFEDLRPAKGEPISAAAFRCFNLGGVDQWGRQFTKSFGVEKGKVRALWFGVQIPRDATVGEYQGSLTIMPKGEKETVIPLSLSVAEQVLEDHGDHDLWRQARLRWLDSTIGMDDEVTPPYTPLAVHGQTVSCLGREVKFSNSGLPGSILSNKREILAGPMAIVVETDQGDVVWGNGTTKVLKTTHGAVEQQAESAGGAFGMTCRSRMEFDGHLDFSVRLKARQAARVRDIRLEIPIRREIATYMMGIGCRGGYRPHTWKWAWNGANNQLWIGEWNAGLYCRFRGPGGVWEQEGSATDATEAWNNRGQAGCTVAEEGQGAVWVRAYSGPRDFKPGEEILLRFSLLPTPVKPLDPTHWRQRYYHFIRPIASVETVVNSGASIVNIHSGSEINPNINYPFLAVDALCAYIKEAHAKGLKANIYYTVRLLSNHAAELWALRSLGNEVISDGPGQGAAWLQEHLGSGYSMGWYEKETEDFALDTAGLSRWNNYYLEGLVWLCRNVHIDGLYLDGIGYGRELMKRLRKVLDRNRPGCLLDLHSGDSYPGKKVSSACYYMEHFPYLNSLWFGEGYDYLPKDRPPDDWLIELSGIPFGLFGEMLYDGGFPWHGKVSYQGMVYGMTGRQGAWCPQDRPRDPKNTNPRYIWKVWDEFGIQDARMVGYWDSACPVKTNNKDVLATAYCKKDKVLIALASWAKEPIACRLEIDWRALGLDPGKARLVAPEVPEFQKAALFSPTDVIPIEAGKGWMLILQGK